MKYDFFQFMEFWQVFIMAAIICAAAATLLHAATRWLKQHTHLRWVRFFVRSDIQEIPPAEEKQDKERSA